MDGPLQPLQQLEEAQSRHPRRRPFITAAYARSRDGCLARARGERTELSGPESLELTHRLRALHGALVIGVNTVIADDPLLTTRLAPGPSPLRVVLDTHLRTPDDARLIGAGAPGTWVACGPDASAAAERRLGDRGVRVLRCPADARGVRLPAVIAMLARAGVNAIMVEGGARVLASFVREHLIDFACVTIAPFDLASARAVTLIEDPLASPALATRTTQIGRDVVVCASLGEDRT